MSGPRVVFEGQMVGLVAGGSRGGNASSAYDYALYCKCTAEDGKPVFLGVLGGFRVNANGDRTAYCPHCQHVTVVDSQAQVKVHAPFKHLAEVLKPAGT